MAHLKDVFKRAYQDPAFEARTLSKRPLRGVQPEMIKRVENFLARHEGGVMTVLSSRQTGKNETSAILQRRHLWRHQNSRYKSSWIRTAPTHEPQIVNSKKRLEELMQIDRKNVIGHPMFLKKKIQKSEGYIWKLGNATVEFMSSGPHSNVVGATASECLDMDEAHKINLAKFDEDFAPFTASTNAGTLLWGVAADGMDVIEHYRKLNQEQGREDLNLYYPCDIWAEANPIYAAHLESRIKALGYDHPIFKTQYRLLPVANEGTYLNSKQVRSLLSGEHERHIKPERNRQYEILIDLAAGNEDFNPDSEFVGEGETATDSTIIWIYEVTDELAANGLFPKILIRNLIWWTGVSLVEQEAEIEKLIEYWNAGKVTIDAVGVGRQIAESMAKKFGSFDPKDEIVGGGVHAYVANKHSVSDDCFDLLARLNADSVKMFADDGSEEYKQFTKQCGWTKYQSSKGCMNLIKPKSDKHIDMIKALTYFNQNKPDKTMQEIYRNESSY